MSLYALLQIILFLAVLILLVQAAGRVHGSGL